MLEWISDEMGFKIVTFVSYNGSLKGWDVPL